AGNKAVEQRTVQAVTVLKRIQDAKIRFRVQVQGGMADGGQVHQQAIAMTFVQGHRQIDRDGGSSAATLGIKHGNNAATIGIIGWFAAIGLQSRKRLHQAVGAGWTVEKFASSGTHGVHNDLALHHVAAGENSQLRELEMKPLDSAQRRCGIARRNINQQHLGFEFSDLERERLQVRQRILEHGAARRGSIYHGLQQVQLLAFRSQNSNRCDRHNKWREAPSPCYVGWDVAPSDGSTSPTGRKGIFSARWEEYPVLLWSSKWKNGRS